MGLQWAILGCTWLQWAVLGNRGFTALHRAVMDCTGLYLAELDFAVLYWSLLDRGGGGGGKRKIEQCSGRPETSIVLAFSWGECIEGTGGGQWVQRFLSHNCQQAIGC